MRVKTLVFTLVAALASTGIAVAGGDKTKDTKKEQPAEPKLTEAEVQLLDHHHWVNTHEIELGKIAKKKGTKKIQKYVTALVSDHEKADKKAMALAKARGVALDAKASPNDPTESELRAKAHAKMTELQALDGADFDKAYLQAMVDGHNAEVARIEASMAAVVDKDLKKHFEGVKVTVKKHADEAKALLPTETATK
jgi:putative membrane protein